MSYSVVKKAGGMILILMLGLTFISCQTTSMTTNDVDPERSTLNQTERGFNPQKNIQLTVKNFSDELGLDEGELGGWRLVNSENRTAIIATEGDRISWTAGQDFALQFQFPEKLARNLFQTVKGDDSIFNDRFTFLLKPGETLTVRVQNPHPESMQHLYELQYSVLNVEAGELVEGDSPPRMIFMFN